ncbi:hypothetical protein [Mesorhizobium sp. A623]
MQNDDKCEQYQPYRSGVEARFAAGSGSRGAVGGQCASLRQWRTFGASGSAWPVFRIIRTWPGRRSVPGWLAILKAITAGDGGRLELASPLQGRAGGFEASFLIDR